VVPLPIVPLILSFAPFLLVPPTGFVMTLLPVRITTDCDARCTNNDLSLTRRNSRSRYRADCDAGQ
jgi:hypothetical protein